MAPLNVLMVDLYTTGFVGGGMSGSDKKVGVVGLTLFDLRRRGKVGKLSMVGTSGSKFPAIREHLQKNISSVYNNLHVSFDSFPSDATARDPHAYKSAIDALLPGDAITIFTPDTTHYPIALYAIPKVATGNTFKAWAGKDSDISYYLNSHYVDISEWMVPDYRPITVTASGSKGRSEDLGCAPGTEDTISLLVVWEKKGEPDRVATGVYTASWTAPQRAGVHSNQSFHYLASEGEIRVDQAKRGYDVADDSQGQIMWYNPSYMKYSPVDSVTASKEGKVTLDDLDKRGLPTLKNTVATTAILEAGRMSLDESRTVQILKDNGE